MTSKERLTRLFAGKDIDRIPIWLLFPYFKSPAYANIFEIPEYTAILPYIMENTDTIERHFFNTGFCFSAHSDVITERENIKTADGFINRSVIRYKDLALSASFTKGKITETENYIKEPEDILRVLEFPYAPVQLDYSLFKKNEIEMGENGMMGVNLPDPLSALHDICSETDFALFAYTEREIVKVFLDEMLRRCLIFLKKLLDDGISEIFWISGAEFAAPPMLPPYLFTELAGRQLKEICDLIHSYRKSVMLHCHGKIRLLLPYLREIGFDAIHPIEPPPMGDCTLTQAREAFGNTVLTGNLQYGDLWDKSNEETEALVRRAIIGGSESGRFILSISGGPSAEKITERMAENYVCIIETAKKYFGK